jgi:uncharacterized protein (TIGR00297 family)
MRRTLAGLGVSMLVAAGGWKARSLDTGGALAATLVGTAITAGTSWPGVATLGTFFVSSSALSKVRPSSHLAAKGSQRDAAQVLANGGAAAVAAAGLARVERGLALTVAAGSLAAATADTWATEVGSSSGAVPRLLVSRRPVEPGESGGVTIPGTAASVAGAMLIGSVAAIAGSCWSQDSRALKIFPAVVVAGICGSVADSLAGELVQERRFCPTCGVVTEAIHHRCGTLTNHISGVRGVTNDTVNVMCTVAGALAAYAVYLPWSKLEDN